MEYGAEQRREYLEMTDRIGGHWLGVFEDDTRFYSAAYWDLFTRMWRAGAPVRKTDALRFMTAVKSARTAGKYLEVAIARGFILERENPRDARSRLVELSPEMRRRLDAFLDSAVDELRRAARTVERAAVSRDGS